MKSENPPEESSQSDLPQADHTGRSEEVPHKDGQDSEPGFSQTQPFSSPDRPTQSDTGPHLDRRLGEFQLLRRLGRGGMAEVYLARQISLNRYVAVKILREELLSDDVYLQRFEQEAKAAAALNHSNIVQVYAIGEEEGVHFIAQEYVQGQNLKEYLNRHGTPGPHAAVHIMKQVVSALQAAWEAGIVHRDIKPENIMISRKGEVKVADFGLAQLTLGEERVNLTQVGITMGTPLYMSPEQVNGKKLDLRSDIYSLGVTCYHMLSGRPPFWGETALSIAVQHLNSDIPPLQQKRPDLPPPLCNIIHRMMAKAPQQRYPDAQSILRDLKKVPQTNKRENGAEDLIAKLDSSVTLHRGWFRKTWDSCRARLIGKTQAAAFFLACLLVFFLSAVIGGILRPAAPLEIPPPESGTIPVKDTVEEQYSLAMHLEYDEEAWKAVIDNFPQESFYRDRAEQQLAMLHLKNQRFEQARTIFNKFASWGGEKPDFQANGWAGLAVIASLQKNFAKSQRIIATKLFPIRDRLNPEMESLVREAIRRNRSVLGSEVQKDYENLFQSTPSADESNGFEPE